MITIPNQQLKQWNQPNTSDLMGNLYLTKNITFDEEGYLKLSYSPRNAMDETVDADFDNPAVILFCDDYGYFVETWDAAFSVDTSILLTRPTQIATAGVPSGDIQSDAVWFGGLMVVTQDTDVDYYDPAANSWTDTNITLTNTSQSQHACVEFLSLSALAIADVNTIKLYATPITATPVLITTLTISSNFHITAMCYFNQNLYIATQNRYGGHAFMYVWNGLGTAAQQAYEVDSNMIFSLCVHDDAVWLITGNGSLLRFNGGGFDGVDEGVPSFPIFYTDQSLTDTVNISMYKNIMKSNGNLLYVLFTNQENDSNRFLDMPDGLWCYDSKLNMLYHRYSLSNSLVLIETIATASVNTTTNQITVANNYVTGTEVYYNNSGTLIPELLNNAKYYVIRVDSTHIKLAYTYTEAIAGTAIDLTGTGFATQKLVFFPNTDFGQFYSERTFSLNIIERPVATTQYGTDLMYGAGVASRQLGSLESLGTVSSGVGARGYFITPKIFSTDITDNFDLLTLKFSKFTSDIDKIIIKYRTVDDMRRYINIGSGWGISWTSATTFTTTQPDWEDAVIGDEVEILKGAGAGLLAHITAISESGGTYTVTLDDSFFNYVAADTAKAVFRNWTKFKIINYGDSNAEQFFLSEHMGISGKWVQLKIELRGVQTRIEELLLDNVYRLPASDK